MTDEIIDFTRCTSFCLTLGDTSLIPDDHSAIEWVVLVGYANGSSLALIDIASSQWQGSPPFNLFMEAILENEDVIAFLRQEEGAIITYKRVEGGPKSLN